MVRLTTIRRIPLAVSAVCAMLSLWGNPAFAGDPFRSSSPRNIGDKTEAAFKAIFLQGNYLQAKQYLEEATKTESNEPLAHAMRASLAYSDEDWATMKTYADKTLDAAQKLTPQDPLRGNLYIAVGHFLEGAYNFKTQGPLGAVDKLQQVFQYVEIAEKASPNDPELNLLKGYLDLLLAVYLPFSKPEEAIARFEKYAAPDYMVNRALSSAYRDLKQYDKAQEFIDKALQSSPENPELQYLKGQLLRNKGRLNKNMALLQEALTYYEKAMPKIDQLPESVKVSLRHEYNAVQHEIQKLKENPNIDKL